MNQIRVEHGQVDAMKADLKTRNDGIEHMLRDLGNQIKELEAMWEGSGSDAFRMQKDKWFTSADDLNKVLNQIVIAIGNINDNYRTTDSDAARRIGG